MATWPNNLQQALNVSSFSEGFGETLLRSDMDIGPAKVRRRTTRPINVITGTINLLHTEYATFKTFFNTTINGGATRFTVLHPISGNTVEARFAEPPVISPLASGGRIFVVGMKWEIFE